MGRSGYSDDLDQGQLACWRGAVASAIRGKRGQAFLREMLAALDAMPVKRLIRDNLADGGEVCAIGSVGAQRGMDMSKLDADDAEKVGKAFGISRAMAAEIEYENDQEFSSRDETPEQRWERIRKWVVSQLAPEARP